MKQKTKLLIIAGAAVVLLSLIGGLNLYFRSDAVTAARHLDMGQRYLDELNYEQAVAEFQKVLEIDSVNADAYLGLAKAYAGLGDTEQALEILKQGYELTGDERLLEAMNGYGPGGGILLRPLKGDILLPFSMEASVHFVTLNVYKNNPAMMISAPEGTAVAACADGVVIKIDREEEIGNYVTMDLGNGYEMIYGQLKDIKVSEGDTVKAGESFAAVAAPTKYFVLEGSNLYLEFTLNGDPVNPEDYMN